MEETANKKRHYGFIYITTNLINGKKYIGQKVYDKLNNWKSYLGSGKAFKSAIKKYGKENFVREIIEECDSDRELDVRERYWIAYYDAVKSKDYYNISGGGDHYGSIGRPVYCVELKTFYRNNRIASVYTDEDHEYIYAKAKEHHRNKGSDVRRGYHYWFLEDMYPHFSSRCLQNGKPVYNFDDEMVYGSWMHVDRCFEDIKYTRRKILSIKRYEKLKNDSLEHKLIRLEDIMKVKDVFEVKGIA